MHLARSRHGGFGTTMCLLWVQPVLSVSGCFRLSARLIGGQGSFRTGGAIVEVWSGCGSGVVHPIVISEQRVIHEVFSLSHARFTMGLFVFLWVGGLALTLYSYVAFAPHGVALSVSYSVKHGTCSDHRCETRCRSNFRGRWYLSFVLGRYQIFLYMYIRIDANATNNDLGRGGGPRGSASSELLKKSLSPSRSSLPKIQTKRRRRMEQERPFEGRIRPLRAGIPVSLTAMAPLFLRPTR